MNVARLDLSKELYELSEWDNGWYSYWGRGVVARDSTEQRICPAYDLGYLLRKLPKMGSISVTSIIGAGWEAVYHGNRGDLYERRYQADTPEDAVCKLAIELFKQDILKR